jgi:tetratricopeptide (TPR) repeat protein
MVGEKALTAELGDLLTLQGRALLAGKNYLRAEELLDEALAQYEDDHARAAEAMLALGQLFRETRSDMYAEGMYRKLLSVIARNPGEVRRKQRESLELQLTDSLSR